MFLTSLFETIADLLKMAFSVMVAAAVLLAPFAVVGGWEYLVDEVILPSLSSETQNSLPPTYEP
jgi:hypothetical protein